MIVLEIGDKKYEMPEDWCELTIGTFQKICDIPSSEDDITKTVRMISAASGAPEEELMNLPYTEYKKLVKVIGFVQSRVPEKLLRDFVCGGTTYKFQCDLIDMTTAEYFDLDTLSKDSDHSNLHMLMAIMYRPEGEKYDSKKVRDRAIIFKDCMTMDYCVGAQVFMEVLGLTSYQSTQGFSPVESVAQM